MVLGVLLVRRGDLGDPRVQVLRADPAQHRVDELRPPVADLRPGQLHGGRDGGVAGDPGGQQLVRAEREHVQDRRVHLAQRPVDAGGDDRVVGALQAQRAVDEFGGERGVAPVHALLLGLPQQRGQDQVGVGVPLVDGAQGAEGDAARRILLGTAVRAGARLAGLDAGVLMGASKCYGDIRNSNAGTDGHADGRTDGNADGRTGDPHRSPSRRRQPPAVTSRHRQPPSSSPLSIRTPRAQSAARIGFLPCGWTSPSSTS